MDGGLNGNGNTFYEQGFCTAVGSTSLNRGGQASTGTTGLPHPGTQITSGSYTSKCRRVTPDDWRVIGNYAAGAM